MADIHWNLPEHLVDMHILTTAWNLGLVPELNQLIDNTHEIWFPNGTVAYHFVDITKSNNIKLQRLVAEEDGLHQYTRYTKHNQLLYLRPIVK